MTSLREQAGVIFGSFLFGFFVFLTYDFFNRLFFRFHGKLFLFPFYFLLFLFYSSTYYIFINETCHRIINIFYPLSIILGFYIYFKFFRLYFLRSYSNLIIKIKRKIINPITRLKRNTCAKLEHSRRLKKNERKKKKRKNNRLDSA